MLLAVENIDESWKLIFDLPNFPANALQICKIVSHDPDDLTQGLFEYGCG